jgi:hypothetical protein
VVCGPAEAAFIFVFNEQGPNVIVIGSGSLDLTDLSNTAGDDLPASGVSAQDGLARVAGKVAVYAGVAGPLSFGAGGHVAASTGGGDAVAINGLFRWTTSRAPPLSNSMEFAGQTLASLGLTPGAYTWSWGSGANADSLTVRISAAAIPEPATGLGLTVGLLGLAASRCRQAKSGRQPPTGTGAKNLKTPRRRLLGLHQRPDAAKTPRAVTIVQTATIAAR